jgi:hypothetical protein
LRIFYQAKLNSLGANLIELRQETVSKKVGSWLKALPLLSDIFSTLSQKVPDCHAAFDRSPAASAKFHVATHPCMTG